jgi:microcystin-dependent protein
MLVFGGTFAPTGWLVCDGRSVLRADYPQLYTAIGTRHGQGAVPGTTFALPNLVGRLAMGANETTMPIGTQVGARTIKITANQMPSHRHDLASHQHAISHEHAGGTSGNENADHEHGFSVGGGGHEHFYSQPSARSVVGTPSPAATVSNYAFVSAQTAGGGGGGHSHSGGTGGINRNHQHSVSVPAYSGWSGVPNVNETSLTGGNADVDITPPVTAVLWMIKF